MLLEESFGLRPVLRRRPPNLRAVAVRQRLLEFVPEDPGLDGRSVFYHGVPTRREGSVVCGPGRDVHVLVTSPDTRGRHAGVALTATA